MATDQSKQKDRDRTSAETKGNSDNSINPKEDFHVESGEKKNALKNDGKERLMGMDSPDDAEELGNDTESK